MISKLRRGGRRLAPTLLVACLALLSIGPASAGSFQVNPVNLSLGPDQAATSLMLKNNDGAPVSVRVLTYKWTQVDGRDVYSPTDDVIASPPIFTVPAGASQLVRIGLRSRTAGASYRVIVEEIPQEKPTGTGIQVALRLNLPLYVLNKGGQADVRWTAWRSDTGGLIVEASNLGTLHYQVLEIGSVDAGGNKTVLSKEMGVILPNSARQWKIRQHSGFTVGTPLLLSLRSPSGETQSEVVVESR